MFDPAEEFNIAPGDEAGEWIGTGEYVSMTVENGRCFKRKGVRPFQKTNSPGWSTAKGGCAMRVLLVGEVNGVKTYVAQMENRIHIIVTEQEINP